LTDAAAPVALMATASSAHARVVRREVAGCLSLVELLLLSAVLSTTLLVTQGYSYGPSDQLVLALRQLSPDYLANDSYINNTVGFGPRFYFVALLVACSRALPMPAVVLGLTWAANLLVAFVTMLATRNLCAGRDWTGVIAGALVLSVHSFDLGMAGFLHRTILMPQLLIMPLALLTLWAGIAGRPLIAVTCAIPALLIHPLVGGGSAGLALGAGLLAAVWNVARSDGERRRAAVRAILWQALSLGIVAVSFRMAWGRMAAPALSTAQFIDIYAAFRNPHHCLPSEFPAWDYVQAGLFLVVTLLSWSWWAQEETTDPAVARRVLLVIVEVVLACVGGYVFVEVWPSRMWATAQTFRFLFVLKWLGFVLVANTAATLLQRAGDRAATARGALMVVGAGAAHTAVLFVAHVAEWIRRRGPSVLATRWDTRLTILACAVAIGLLAAFGATTDGVRLLVSAGFCAWFLGARRSWWRTVVPAVVLFAFVGLLTVHHVRPLPVVWRFLNPLRLHVTRDSLRGPVAEIARAAREHTPDSAVLLTPPDSTFGDFRLIAERAIVADVRFYPFDDRAMLEWRQRLDDCYGPVRLYGQAARDEMAANYHRLTDADVLRIAQRYGAQYAILYADNVTAQPTLGQTDVYRLVRVPDSGK
jgi:hypothetical protein